MVQEAGAMLTYLAFSVLVLIAVAHSVLGEREILGPLFAQRWEIAMPRFAVTTILRFAWHLTSIAWVGLAALLLGLSVAHAIAAVCFASAAWIFFALRGHLAWPLFILAGAFALAGENALPTLVTLAISGCTVVLAVGIAALHLYWALGGKRGLQDALPTRKDGSPVFSPGPLACAAVAIACLVFTGLLVWQLTGHSPAWAAWALAAAAGVFGLRAVGDGKQVGFSKQDRSTRFAQADDALYTPLVVALLLGTLSALHVS